MREGKKHTKNVTFSLNSAQVSCACSLVVRSVVLARRRLPMTVTAILRPDARPEHWQPFTDVTRAANGSNAPSRSRSLAQCLRSACAKRRCSAPAHAKTEANEEGPLFRTRSRTPPWTHIPTARSTIGGVAEPAIVETDGTCTHVFLLEREQCQYIRLADVGVASPVIIDLLHIVEEAGLRVGDTLLAVDGLPCVGLTSSLLALYAAPDVLHKSSKCKLLVRRLTAPNRSAKLRRDLLTVWQHDKLMRADSTMRRIDNLRIPRSAVVVARGATASATFGSFGGMSVAFPVVVSVNTHSLRELRLGDVLLAVNGTPISSCADVTRVAAAAAGDELSLSVLRWPRREKALFEAARARPCTNH